MNDSSKMRGYYQLSIINLPRKVNLIDAGAVYWVHGADLGNTEQLTVQILSCVDNHAQQKPMLLAQDEVQLEAIINHLGQHAKKVRAYTLKNTKHQNFFRLSKQINRALNPESRLIILCLQADYFQIQDHKLPTHLKQWRDWAEEKNCTLLIITLGPSPQLHPHLLNNNRLLAGYAELSTSTKQNDELISYHVLFWSCHLGPTVDYQAKLAVRNKQYHFVPNSHDREKQITATVSETSMQLFIQRQALELASNMVSERWAIIDTWDALYQHGLEANKAVLVFGLGFSDSVETLARLCFKLRLQRGDDLKIIVRELGQVLREPEIKLLMSCGVTALVPQSNVVRFFNQLETILSQPSTYKLTDDIEHAIALATPLTIGGVLNSTDFADALESIYQHHKTNSFMGSLVALRPVPAMTAATLASQLALKRQGDIACTVNNTVYIFLFACPPKLVHYVLNRVFTVPYTELIIESEQFADYDAIEEQIKRIRNQRLSETSPTKVVKPVQPESQVFQPKLASF